VDKVETLTHYKFSLAFENSNEEDYVTEKFFQSLVAGMEYINYLPSSHYFHLLHIQHIHVKIVVREAIRATVI
jgi:hypothetical protein